MMLETDRTIAAARIADAFANAFVDGEGENVVDALYEIAKGLQRIGAALDGPWPKALADALNDRPGPEAGY